MNCQLYIEIIEAIYLCENELMTELLVFDSKTCKHLIVCKKDWEQIELFVLEMLETT